MQSRIAPRAKSEKIRNVDQNGRILDRASPLATAPDTNSRMPKCRLRPRAFTTSGSALATSVPPGWLVPAWPGASSTPKSPAPSKVSRVFVDGARSAAPPMSHGTFFAIAFSTAPDVSRVALPSGPPGTRGCRRPSPPAAPAAACAAADRRARGARPSSARRAPSTSRSLRPRARRARRRSARTPVGHPELRIFRPAVEPLGGAHLVLAKARRASGCPACAGAVRDGAVDDDQRRPMLLVAECRVGARQHGEVVGVADTGDVPAQADEPGGDILGKGQRRAPFDGDRVVVVDPAQVRQVQVPGERCRFRGDALHHVAVAAQRRRRSQTSRSPGG